MKIRYLSSADDRTAISRIYEESWKYAYQGIIPQEYLDSIPRGQWASNLDNPNLKTLVCIEDGRFIGTSSFGKKLLQATVSELKKLGFEDVFLWVLEENVRASRFYERFGFLETSDYLGNRIGGKDLREIRYTYDLKNRDRSGTDAYQ